MPGVPKDFAEHKLHVRSDAKPVKQPLRRLSEEKRRIVGEEIARLLAAVFIMEVFFPEWLANPILVLKKNKQWPQNGEKLLLELFWSRFTYRTSYLFLFRV